MDFKRYMIFTKPMPPLKQLMTIIRITRTDGQQAMEKILKCRKKKAYISSGRIIKVKMQTDKRSRFQKAGKGGEIIASFFVIQKILVVYNK